MRKFRIRLILSSAAAAGGVSIPGGGDQGQDSMILESFSNLNSGIVFKAFLLQTVSDDIKGQLYTTERSCEFSSLSPIWKLCETLLIFQDFPCFLSSSSGGAELPSLRTKLRREEQQRHELSSP